MCVHGIWALVIYAKGCWIQRHHLWDFVKKKKTETPLYVFFLVPTVDHAVDHAKAHMF